MKTVCFDFDGVLASYDGWKDGAIGGPLPVGVKLLRLCDEAGYRIVIQSCRTHPDHENTMLQLTAMKSWLRKHKIPCDYIEIEGKAMANVYVDDRGLHFDQDMAKQEDDEHTYYLFREIQERMELNHDE